MVKERQRVTSYEVAEKAGVSQSTVSRALKGHPSVALATRERIAEVAKSLNYQVDVWGSRMRTGAIDTLALVVISRPEDGVSGCNPVHYTLLAATCAAASRQGLETIVSFQNTLDNVRASYELERKALGMIVIGTSENLLAWDCFRAQAQAGAHLVCWGTPYADLPWVRADNHGGGAMATRHLIAQGAREIVFLGGDAGGPPQFAERAAGYAQAMGEAGLRPRIEPLCVAPGVDGATRAERGHHAMRRLLAQGAPIDGVFAACDDIALGALAALREAGGDAPAIRVIGFDGTRQGGLSSPALCSIEPDFARAGELLVERFMALHEEREAPELRVPVRLVVRESSLIPAG